MEEAFLGCYRPFDIFSACDLIRTNCVMFDFEVGAWGAPWSLGVGLSHHDAIYHLLCRARILWVWFDVLFQGFNSFLIFRGKFTLDS